MNKTVFFALKPVSLLFLVSMLAPVATAPCGFAAAASDKSPPAIRSVLHDPNFFPIAVWLQSPANAERYRAAGINTYVGLWKGPTAAQLAALKKAGMHVICSQNNPALRNISETSILAWMHGDEPDNAQPLASGKGWGPPISPEKIVADYREIKARDPHRPVLLNLGQGVAWDRWHGRGVRSNHPEDYPKYMEGCDIVSFDIYPAVHDKPEVAGNLWYVARGVERLVQWSGGRKTVWNCLECTRIGNPERKPTPDEVKAEAWMSIIHGSRGLIYFVHQFKPEFREAALLDDSEMLEAVTKLNNQIASLAPVIKSDRGHDAVSVTPANTNVPIAVMSREYNGSTYIFAVCMRNESVKATFNLQAKAQHLKVDVLEESRQVELKNGAFEDLFGPWDSRIYKLP